MTTIVIRSTIDRRQNKRRPGIVTRILDILAVWHDRGLQRRTIGGLTEYQLHDIGLSRSQVSYEIEKPFWRL